MFPEIDRGSRGGGSKGQYLKGRRRRVPKSKLTRHFRFQTTTFWHVHPQVSFPQSYLAYNCHLRNWILLRCWTTIRSIVLVVLILAYASGTSHEANNPDFEPMPTTPTLTGGTSEATRLQQPVSPALMALLSQLCAMVNCNSPSVGPAYNSVYAVPTLRPYPIPSTYWINY